jgi:hypothetical protein
VDTPPDAEGRPRAPVGVVTGADLWSVAFPPVTGIAPVAIGAVLQASPGRDGPTADPHDPTASGCPAARRDPRVGRSKNWVGVRNGAVVLEIKGIGHPADPGPDP